MKKLISLLKATMSQDMNLFKYKTNKQESKLKKTLFPFFMVAIIMFSIGTYAFMFAEELSKINLTYIMLTLFIIVTTLLTFIEGIYKSQGILFDSKDNDLLLSLPIEKSKVFSARIFKLLLFQYLYNSLFLVPAFAVYIFYERPSASFYFISILMTFLLPIIPTIVATIIGYIIKAVSTKFKAKKMVQTTLTMILLFAIFYASFNMQNLIANLAQNAKSINELLTNIYYPVGLYINIIQNFQIINLLILITINILPLIIVIFLSSKYYFRIISKASEKGNNKRKNRSKEKYNYLKKRTQIMALINKELKRYFSSPVYIINTSFGLIIILLLTICISVNLDGVIGFITKGQELGMSKEIIIQLMPKIFYQIVLFMVCMTSITSSSISMEGKSFNITKSLPTSISKILSAKIITSNIITIPIILISDLIFFAAFKINIINIIFILAVSIIMPTFIAILGLLINLKYPKMNALSDTEVVKQSVSSMVAVLGGMTIGIFSIITMVLCSNKINLNIFITLELIALTLISFLLWKVVNKYGQKRFRQINV